jgi:anaerobic ribonucleoside-triphosphate reductase activating protein
MNIAGLDYDLNNKALCIFLSGCDGYCQNCHNESLWDFNTGRSWKTWKRKIHQHSDSKMLKRFFLMGGEPLLQNITQLEGLLIFLEQFDLEIWLWTRFYEIPKNIKQYIDYAKVGEYQCDSDPYTEPLFGITLASTNQRIIKINP